MDYTIRVIATNLIVATTTVEASSQEEAFARVEQRISPKLKQEGYAFDLAALKTKAQAKLAA